MEHQNQVVSGPADARAHGDTPSHILRERPESWDQMYSRLSLERLFGRLLMIGRWGEDEVAGAMVTAHEEDDHYQCRHCHHGYESDAGESWWGEREAEDEELEEEEEEEEEEEKAEDMEDM